MVKFTSFKTRRFNDTISQITSFPNPFHAREALRGRKRLISKDGNINFQRLNIEHHRRYLQDIFTSLLDLTWLWILTLFVICFVTSWVFFALIWYIIMVVHGDFSSNNSNSTNRCVDGVKTFGGLILYSIETQQTIGYGTRAVTENCTAGIFLLIIQSCFGLIIQALWVGLVYTKLSRPKKRRRTLMWSDKALITIRDGYLTLQCRLGDMRYRSTLVEAHIRMYFVSKRLTKENEIIPLNLIDMNVGYDEGKDRLFFNWPIIIEHKINDKSPLFDFDKEQILKEKFEILIVLEGIIEPTGMVTQARTSYMPDEIVWGARFERMIHFLQHQYVVDYSKFNSFIYDNLTTHLSAKQFQEQQQQANSNSN
ncbi:unnamed protein product [Adineta steineri]|uniref:Uncharacterized protein n=1 Tax=Adineta steineri TaxID=433720 RepID=A0A815CNX5_9BILA|nr:unnamed protein product [Adineta steineri]CAF3765070.1 unnamed protein product [Adineta steineri]